MGAFSCLSDWAWTEFTKALSAKDKENLSLFEHLLQGYNIFCHHIRAATMRYNGKVERSNCPDICCANPPSSCLPCLTPLFLQHDARTGLFVIFGALPCYVKL